MRYLVVAIGLFVTTLGFMMTKRYLARHGNAISIGVYQQILFALAVVILVPAVQAYRNGGILVSWLLGSVIPVALYLPILPYHLGSALGAPQGGIVAALQFGIPAGTIGFVLGAGIRRVRKLLMDD